MKVTSHGGHLHDLKRLAGALHGTRVSYTAAVEQAQA